MGIGAYPAAPRIGFPISDVRDVAATHALAMVHPKAAGERFLSANGFLRLIEVGRLMVEVLPDLKRKAPKFEMHDWAVRALSIVDRRLRAVLPDLGHPRPASNAKATASSGSRSARRRRPSDRPPRACARSRSSRRADDRNRPLLALSDARMGSGRRGQLPVQALSRAAGGL